MKKQPPLLPIEALLSEVFHPHIFQHWLELQAKQKPESLHPGWEYYQIYISSFTIHLYGYNIDLHPSPLRFWFHFSPETASALSVDRTVHYEPPQWVKQHLNSQASKVGSWDAHISAQSMLESLLPIVQREKNRAHKRIDMRRSMSDF